MLAEYRKAHRDEPDQQGRVVRVKHELIRWNQTSTSCGPEVRRPAIPQVVPSNGAVQGTGPAHVAPTVGNEVV